MLTLKLLRGYQMKLVIVKFRIQKKKSILDILVKVKNSLTWKTLGLPKAFGDIHGKETH